MSPPSADDDDAPATAGDHYQVGYRKPPTSRRFKKGVSGNPAGRPRKRRAEPQIGGEVTLADEQWLKDADELVNVRVDGQLRRVRAIEAMTLRVRSDALAGKASAQRTYITCVAAASRAVGKQKHDQFSTFIDVKAVQQKKLEQRQSLGLPIDDVLPHPADILINPRTGWARCVGPVEKAERDAYEPLIRLRDQLQEDVSAARREYEDAEAEQERSAIERWHVLQRVYDKINDKLPPSLQRKLVDRSTARGASKAGDFLKATAEEFEELERKGALRRK